ncbi:MAG: PKD domain-containing protein [Candidatus Thermoplasmatota archaeon]|nr:PKD domain-containing protein [Candidatus Thermoplasmatota archaeon]
MMSKWKDLLLAVILVAVLAIPVSLAGAEDRDTSGASDDIIFNSSLESTSDLVNVEKLETPEFLSDMSDIEFVSPEDAPFGFSASSDHIALDVIDQDPVNIPEGYIKAFDRGSFNTMGTRASDEEQEQSFSDYPNGSIINTAGEDISGSLTWSNVAANRDDIDWYKLSLTNIATIAGGSPVKNISLSLDSYSASDGEMYEFAIDSTGTALADDYADLIEIYVLSRDDMFGRLDIGGAEWWYDDGDDTDGWTWDSNWTFDFWTPRHSTSATEDPDGFANRLTEMGWIYIGICYNYYISAQAPTTRPGFTADYQFTVGFNSDTVRDAVGNHWKNATAFSPLGSTKSNIIMSSNENIMDWWKFSGTDTSKLWNMSMRINRTGGVIYSNPTTTQFWDNWLEILIIWREPGEDEIWDTPDDDYAGAIFIMSVIISGGNYIGDTLSVWLHNNWTEAAERGIWVGLNERPVHGAIQSGQIAGFYYPEHWVWSEYQIALSVGEVAPNIPPIITDVELTSDFAQDPTGGYYDTEFLLTVTYQDEDDDPPSEIWVYLDKGTPYEKAVDIATKPTDVFDNDYTDGKKYKLEMLGEDLTDDPSPHTVDVRAIDKIPSASIRDPEWSELFNFEAGIPVWDDEPVEKNPNWQPFDELQEDDPTTYFALEGIDGMFKDPENSFEVFYIYNETSKEWAQSYDTPIATIEVLEYDGIWQAAVTPKHNENGKVNVRFQAEDLHSRINLSTQIVIRAVNDPPMVRYIEIDGDEYEVDNVDPRRAIIHLEDEVVITEDEEFTFSIIAEDTDKEDERTPLEFGYVRSTSSDWDEDPDVGYNTGEVTFTPTNNDVRAGNDKMVFTIDDHGEDGDIKLEVYVEITNENDPPTIMIPTTTPRTWKQFSKISIRPIASDEDKGDQITFSVNFVEAIGADYDSIEDQLPYLEATKGIDWDITPTTGDFWFNLDDQNIWKTSTGMVKSQEIVIVFKATDKELGEATASITLVLNDENEEPEKPSTIKFSPSAPEEKAPVNFYVDPVTDPDGDKLTYKWDFGDGSTGEGINVNHTYATRGFKTVQMWVEDGQFSTEKISQRIEVAPAVVIDDDDDILTPDDDVQPANDNTMLYIIVAIIIVVIIIVILLFVFLLLRKKPAPAAQTYPGYYDQQALAGYGQQGLPPGYAGELPPQTSPELPPAGGDQMPPENLPPADIEGPTAQPEIAPMTDPAAAEPVGNACPSCGSPVDPTWFLCPNCKSPLQ